MDESIEPKNIIEVDKSEIIEAGKIEPVDDIKIKKDNKTFTKSNITNLFNTNKKKIFIIFCIFIFIFIIYYIFSNQVKQELNKKQQDNKESYKKLDGDKINEDRDKEEEEEEDDDGTFDLEYEIKELLNKQDKYLEKINCDY
jgi:flagellar biosynthesis/type III secretory pathway M-ring protein FliF/YscJ